MSLVLCDQCSVHLKCDTREEDCPRKCSETCFDLGYRHVVQYNWWAFKPLIEGSTIPATIDASDARIVFEDFSWGATSNSSTFIGTVTDNAF